MSEPIIELKNANIYQGNNLILQDVNLTVNKGEFVYLVGKTGTGKSSLLKTLYGELELKEGEATVAGFNLKGLDWKKVPYLRRTLGVVFQDFQLLTDRNVNDNLKFVLRATGWTDEKLMNEKTAVGEQLHLDGFGEARQCLVHAVVDDLLGQMVGAGCVGVHARTLAHRV